MASVTLGWVSELDFGQRGNLGLDVRGNFHHIANKAIGGDPDRNDDSKADYVWAYRLPRGEHNRERIDLIAAAIIQQWHFGGTEAKNHNLHKESTPGGIPSS